MNIEKLFTKIFKEDILSLTIPQELKEFIQFYHQRKIILLSKKVEINLLIGVKTIT
jgi:hypothetical protein